MEADESFLDAVVRESLEETAWNFQPEHATGIYRWQIPGTDQVYLRHCFAGPANGPVSDRPLDDTILRAVWLSQEQLQRQADKLRSPLVLACIEDYLAGQRFPLNLYREIDRN